MLKKLKKILKKGAMSVEYIVIGVCVIGMAALATTFVSNKMSVAMGQENNSGDTNNGENTGDNNSNNSNLSSICNDNKTFFETYGIYPGKYDISENLVDILEYKTEINVNGNCTFDVYRNFNSSDKYLYSSLNVNLNTNEVCSTGYRSDGSIFGTYEGTFLKFVSWYSDKILTKAFCVQWEHSTDGTQNYSSYLPKEAFVLGNHDDCVGFRTEKQDFVTLNNVNYGEFSVNGDDNQKLIISENKIEYIDSTSNIHLIYDFVNETVHDVNSGLVLDIIKTNCNSGTNYSTLNIMHTISGDISFNYIYIRIGTDKFNTTVELKKGNFFNYN